MKASFFVSWDDVPHLSSTQKDTMLAAVPPWQRDSRSKGIPQLGAGAIYTVPESDFTVMPFALPKHWPRCAALRCGLESNRGFVGRSRSGHWMRLFL